MQNSPTVVAAPPPRPAGQITVIPFPPPHPFDGAPSSIFQITVLPFPPPPPFAGPPSSVDLSPLEFLLALLAVVTIPALIYTFIFAFGCSSHRSRRDPSASEPSVSSEASHREIELPTVDAGVKYRKDEHAKEISGECTVCLSVFAEGEEIRQLSACKHSFHASCIDLWLSNNSSCPICRATIAVVAATKANGDLHESHGERDESNIV